MASLVFYLLTALSCIIGALVAIFVIEIFAGVLLPASREPNDPPTQNRGTVAIIIPAHNEGLGLLPTVQDVKAQLRQGDRLVVVADNCTDDTATRAAAAGAETVERYD